jgi:putative ABC transport system substrate-binding protein
VPVIGFLRNTSLADATHLVTAFRQGLKELAFIEGQNVGIEFRSAEDRVNRLPTLVADLVSRKVAVMVGNHNAALAAKSATITVPVVFVTGADPVRDGLVASLNRPGGNVTAATQLNVEVGPKHLELAHELIPAARVIALLVDPTNPLTEPILNGSQAAACILGLQLQVLHTGNAGHFDAAFMPWCECARTRSLSPVPTRFWAVGPGSSARFATSQKKVVKLNTHRNPRKSTSTTATKACNP